MNRAFDEVLAAGTDAMLSAFDTTALRLGTTSQNIEKDFWVCWTLDALFHGLKEAGPRLLFKGGTSLSKGFGLINRFSEDIDVTVFRDDIGEPVTIEELNALSNNKRRARLDAIKTACQAYINGPLRNQLTQILQDRLKAAGLDARAARVRDQLTIEFARYDFGNLRAGAVAGSVCGIAMVSNADGNVIRRGVFYYDGHEAHLDDFRDLEMYSGIAWLRHAIGGTAGPCSKVVKTQEPLPYELLSTLDVDPLKTHHDDPPARFIFDPNRPRTKP
jgi:hypothetical protein